MALRQILYANDARLRQKAKKVKTFGPNLQKLAEDMLETMRQANGVGLAGPQIGVMQRIFVVETPPDEDDPSSGQQLILVNPELVKVSPELEEGQEGCLSIPQWYGLVKRHSWVEVKAKDAFGKNIKLRADDFLARVIQHENDHLDGVLFIDHIDDKEKLWQVLPDDRVEGSETSENNAAETPEATTA
jgi:peptide deformylase